MATGEARRLEDWLPHHRHTVLHACAWKRVHATRNEAIAVARAHPRPGMVSYPCPFLHPGAWHVGSPPTQAGLVRLAAAIRNLPKPRPAPR